MDWIQTFTIIGVLGGILFWFTNRVEADIRQQAERTDKLYQMFIDLIKEGKK